MRYISLDKLRLPSGWITKSKAAAKAVLKGADPNDYNTVWRSLKTSMANLSGTKCWYCETPVDRDDNAVDHFRPKNRVGDAKKKHDGYRWLAFEKTNLRFSCTFCNERRIDVENGTSGGKADRFPLIDESKRVYVSGSVAREEPLLLDPCDVDDCELLGCQQENGQPCSAINNPIANRRIATSITIYHLDREATCIRRHASAVRLISYIMEAKKLYNISERDRSRKEDFINVAKRIYTEICQDAPYSGEMKFLLRGQRSKGHPWMQTLLEA